MYILVFESISVAHLKINVLKCCKDKTKNMNKTGMFAKRNYYKTHEFPEKSKFYEFIVKKKKKAS